MKQPIEITTLYSRCSLCQVAIQSTKGDTLETRLESLLSNLYGHIKKKHTEEGSEIGLRLAAIQQQATTVVLAEYLELHKSTSGQFTDEFINEHCEELANNLCELIGIEDADPEDGDEAEEEEEEDAEVIGEDGEEIDTGVRPANKPTSEVIDVEIVDTGN